MGLPYENLAVHLENAMGLEEEDAFYQARLIMTLLDITGRQDQWDEYEGKDLNNDPE